MDESKKEKIKACIAFMIITLVLVIAGIIVLKYNVEGEKNMPFKLSKIYVISSAEGVENSDSEEKWNFNVYQNNDIYFNIEKNNAYDGEEKIQNVKITNIKITKKPNIGKIIAYMPNSTDGREFSFDEEYILENNSLTYEGSSKTDLKKLNIGNQGGQIVIRFSNVDLGTYTSNDDEQINHDGTMLNKINVKSEDFSFSVTFDLIINIKNKSYKTTIEIDLPTGNILENGTEATEIPNVEKYVFKRM